MAKVFYALLRGSQGPPCVVMRLLTCTLFGSNLSTIFPMNRSFRVVSFCPASRPSLADARVLGRAASAAATAAADAAREREGTGAVAH